MKIDRRGFVKLVVGAGIGVHLTPWPYKIIDDAAIWTQNWPWVPRSTRYPRLRYTRTVCTLCDGGCGLDVRMVNGKNSVKAEGAMTAPSNQGSVCPLAAAGPQYQYGVSRFQGPLKRLGGRGSGSWTKLTWSAAIKEAAGKLAELREAGKADRVALITGRRYDLARTLSERFMAAYGSPNVVAMPGLAQTRAVAEMAQFGLRDRVGYDLENASYVLSFGAQVVEGWGSPVQSIRAYSRWASGGGKLVMVDSRASLTASKANHWIAIAPGTEAALALGLAAVLIADGKFDEEFVGKNTSGFDAFKEFVFKEYNPDKASAITGVDPEAIRKLAHELADSKPSVCIGGRGKGDMPTPAYELMAVMSLNALLGNINQIGGVVVKKEMPLAWPEFKLDAAANETLQKPRLDGARSEQYPWTDGILANLVEAIENSEESPVDVLIIDRADPAFFGADPGAFRRALAKVPFVVSLSPCADDTSINADLVLPASLNFDGGADIVNPPSSPYPLFGAARAVIDDSPFDVKPAADIYIRLAKALGESVEAALPFKNHKDVVETVAAGLMDVESGVVAEAEGKAYGPILGQEISASEFGDADELVEALWDGNFWFDPAFAAGDCEGVFATKTGQFEFVSETLKDALSRFRFFKGGAAAVRELGVTLGEDAVYLPHYEPVELDEDPGLPLLLVPVEQLKLVNSSIGSAPYLVKSLEDLTLKETDLGVDINPETAKHLHLHEGDRAVLRTKQGHFTVRVHLFSGARPGVVYAPIGLGHRGFSLYQSGKGSNPMEIVKPIIDPLSGVRTFWGTKANLTKV